MVIFFTLPPCRIKYPYVLINSHNPKHGLGYIVKCGHVKHVRKVIIDSGVEVFRSIYVKEYPGGRKRHIASQNLLYWRMKNLLRKAEIYVTIPDYPDDYHPKNLWISENKTNIERTIENILYAIEKYPNVKWLIPIQGHNRKPKSLIRFLNLLKEHGFDFEKYDYYAVANLCVERNVEIIKFGVQYVYSWFKENLGYVPKLHVFGLKINALKYIKHFIFSFDSMAWTRPVSSMLHSKYPFSCKNEKQRELFFAEYIKVLKKYGVEVENI